MKIGDYVRTKNCNMPSLIGKITKEEYMTPCNAEHKYIYLIDTKDNNVWFEEDNILESSTNIIDLIEVGDYVNGRKVVDKQYHYTDKDNYDIGEWCIFYENVALGDYQYNIKSIVTKEQFERMQYNLESEVN